MSPYEQFKAECEEEIALQDNAKNSPFFSVVIPTRNRHETLLYVLQTCLKQVDFDDYEVIISDNSDPDNNLCYEAVKQYIGGKVRYIKPPHVLSMTMHYEWILDHVRGEYVTYTGDDDGLTRDALYSCYKCIDETKSLAVTSINLCYIWPQVFDDDTKNSRAWLWKFFPKETNLYTKLISKSYLNKFLDFDIPYQFLPSIYRGMIAQKLIASIRKRYGKFFDSYSPDVYSAMLVATQTEYFVYINRPIFIIGTSRFSTGLNLDCRKQDRKLLDTIISQPPREGYNCAYVQVNMLASALMDSIMCIAEIMPIKLNYCAYYREALKELRTFTLSMQKEKFRALMQDALKNNKKSIIYICTLREILCRIKKILCSPVAKFKTLVKRIPMIYKIYRVLRYGDYANPVQNVVVTGFSDVDSLVEYFKLDFGN